MHVGKHFKHVLQFSLNVQKREENYFHKIFITIDPFKEVQLKSKIPLIKFFRTCTLTCC